VVNGEAVLDSRIRHRRQERTTECSRRWLPSSVPCKCTRGLAHATRCAAWRCCSRPGAAAATRVADDDDAPPSVQNAWRTRGDAWCTRGLRLHEADSAIQALRMGKEDRVHAALAAGLAGEDGGTSVRPQDLMSFKAAPPWPHGIAQVSIAALQRVASGYKRV
jgi:hypothetical protein